MFITIGYTAALVVCHYLLPDSVLIYVALAFAVLGFLGILLRNNSRTIIMLLCFSAAIGFGWSYLHTMLFISPAESLADTKASVEARVLDAPSFGEGYSTMMVRLRGDDYPSCKVLVTDYDAGFSDLEAGDVIRINLRFRSARMRYGIDDDYYFASGVFLRASLDGEYKLLEKGRGNPFFFPKTLSAALKDHILMVFPDDVAPLMKALLTGDKSELYDDDELYVSLRLSGLSHIIAVSGMHVSFIVSLIAIASGRRRITAFIGIPLVWFFAAMMGFVPSVTRASFMISLSLLAPILKRENDPPTSLSAALLLILLCNPQALASISLQLSFAALAGILLITPRIYRSLTGLTAVIGGIIGKFIKGAESIFAASVGAMIFTVPLSALHFGFVAPYSILSNILCLWAMSAAFMLAYPVCIIAAVYAPIGQGLAWIVGWLPRYTIFVVKNIAELPQSALFTNNKYISCWLIFVYAVLFLPYIFRGEKTYRPLIPVCLCLITLPLTLFISKADANKGPAITALDVGQGQCIVATDDNLTVMIDCGGKNTPRNAGDTAAEYLLSAGKSSLDMLILTHLHDDHANGVVRLMNYIDVRRVVLPDDCENTEVGDSIIEMCYDNGTELIYISENTGVQMNELRLELFAPIGSAEPNEHGLIVLGEFDGFDFLVMGDAGRSTEEQLVSFYELDEIELLVAGHHGSKTSTCDALLNEIKPDTAFISVGVNNYGHPADEVLQRLNSHGVEIFRTDINGNITMMVGNN